MRLCHLWTGCLASALAIVAAGCATSPTADDPAPAAKTTAIDRARNDLGCDKVTAEIVSDKGPRKSVYDIDRREYKVEVSGCRKRTTYTVACTKFGVCSALAERAIIERTQ